MCDRALYICQAKLQILYIICTSDIFTSTALLTSYVCMMQTCLTFMEILLCTVQCYNSNKLFNAEVNVSMSNDIIKILIILFSNHEETT